MTELNISDPTIDAAPIGVGGGGVSGGWGGDKANVDILSNVYNTEELKTYADAMKAFKEKFIPLNRGKTFTIEDVLKFFGCGGDKKKRQSLYGVLYNLSEVNKIPILERINKTYRIIERDLKEISWYDPHNMGGGVLEIAWPHGIQDNTSFGFDESVKVYGGDIIMVAGEGNRGKTTFALSFITENMDNYPCYYFTVEFNAPKFRDRMDEFRWVQLFNEEGEPKFKVFEVRENWQDVIQPNAINVIDWIKLDNDMWKIRSIVESIQKKLGNGICLICQQKRSYKKYGEGGEYGKDLSSVYLSISYDEKTRKNILLVEKVKSPGTSDPNYKKFQFNIYNGAEIANIVELDDWKP